MWQTEGVHVGRPTSALRKRDALTRETNHPQTAVVVRVVRSQPTRCALVLSQIAVHLDNRADNDRSTIYVPLIRRSGLLSESSSTLKALDVDDMVSKAVDFFSVFLLARTSPPIGCTCCCWANFAAPGFVATVRPDAAPVRVDSTIHAACVAPHARLGPAKTFPRPILR
jgi:hypothetical protein